jgi:hypothetical protein
LGKVMKERRNGKRWRTKSKTRGWKKATPPKKGN